MLSRPDNVPIGTAYGPHAIATTTIMDHASNSELGVAAITRAKSAVTFETVDPKALQTSQLSCPDTAAHRAGKHPTNVNMQTVEFAPGISLLCDMSKGTARPLVPAEWRDKITAIFHSLSHPGIGATIERVSKRYYWQSMRNDISDYVQSCQICQAIKKGKAIKPPMHPRPVPARRFSQLMFDVIGPLPPSHGMRYLLTVLDRTSRWLEAYPMAEATSKNCVDALIRNWIPTFGLPTSAVCDNGNTFVSKMWKGIHDQLGILVSYTPVYHPASLGHLERQHREIKTGLRASLLQMASEHQGNWLDALPWVMLGRHTVYQPELDASAAEMVMGQCPRIPGDIARSNDPTAPDIKTLVDNLRKLASKEPIQTNFHGKQPVYWPSSVEKATHVWVEVGKKMPLGPTFEGPYPITKRLGTSCLEVQMGVLNDRSPRLQTVHWNNCQPAVMRA